MNIERIHDLADPRVSDFRVVRDRELARRRGLFIAESPLVLETLIERGTYDVTAVLLSDSRLEHLQPILQKLPDDVPVYVGAPSVVDALAGFKMHRSCLATARRPAEVSADAVLEALGPGRRTVVVLDRVSNHDNVGGIFRNAACFGVDAVLLDNEAGDPLYRKAIRVSIAGTLTVPYGRAADSSAILAALRRHGFESWALTPRADAVDVEEALAASAPDRRLALWLGKEGPGLTTEAIEACDRAVRINMSAGPDALNVTSASAVALYVSVR